MTKGESSLDSIARHVAVLNDEVGHLQIDVKGVKNDIKWMKKIMSYMATLMAGIFISVLGGVVKYLFLS